MYGVVLYACALLYFTSTALKSIWAQVNLAGVLHSGHKIKRNVCHPQQQSLLSNLTQAVSFGCNQLFCCCTVSILMQYLFVAIEIAFAPSHTHFQRF